MKCDICKSENTYVKSYEHKYCIKGKNIEFLSERRFCQDCGSLVYDSELDNIASCKAIELYNDVYGVSKEAIINLRKKYNLSQELFAKIIGCAKKTLISYEKGTSIPNDTYMIVLKSLIYEPETISVLIDANKEQFANKEYLKIKERIKGSFNDKSTLSEYNGYTKLDMNKVFNMILYFANYCVLKTKLLKEMFYSDFLFYKKTGKSITGLEYVKLTFGPVPNQFEKMIGECLADDYIKYLIEYQNNYEKHNILSQKEVDKDAFTSEELEVMNKVKDYFKDYNSSEIAEFSHKEKAFIDTDFYKNISYDYAFDITFDE